MPTGGLKALAEVATTSSIFVQFDFKHTDVESFISSWLVSLFCSVTISKVHKDNNFVLLLLKAFWCPWMTFTY